MWTLSSPIVLIPRVGGAHFPLDELLCASELNSILLTAVPMEEVVRAFNYVIDKGWVCGYS